MATIPCDVRFTPDNGHSGAQLARPHWARTRQSTAQSKLSFEGPASAEARGCWCGQSGNWAIAKIALIKAASRTIFSIAHIHASLLPERTIGSVWLAQNVKRGCRQNNRSHACEHDNRWSPADDFAAVIKSWSEQHETTLGRSNVRPVWRSSHRWKI